MASLDTFDDFCVGDEITVARSMGELPRPAATIVFGIHGEEGSELTITPDANGIGQILVVGAHDTEDDTYTATYVIVLPGTYTRAHFLPGVTTRAFVQALCDDGSGPYTGALIDYTPKRGGRYG